MRANAGHRVIVKGGLSTIAAAVALAMLSTAANANTVRINFNGQGMSGYADLTLANDPNASSNYQPTMNTGTPALSQWDPAGAQYITGATGLISWTAASGVSQTSSITGVVATNPKSVPPTFPNFPAAGDTSYENLPASFSWLSPSTGADSYDNLFFANGAPFVCPPNPGTRPGQTVGYPFDGGLFDIFGVMFDLDNGSNYVDLWSAGVMPQPLGLNYGFTVYGPENAGFNMVASQSNGAFAAVPEPGSLWMFGAALLGLFAWRRRREARAVEG